MTIYIPTTAVPPSLSTLQEGQEGFGHAGVSCQRRYSNLRDDTTRDQPRGIKMPECLMNRLSIYGGFLK